MQHEHEWHRVKKVIQTDAVSRSDPGLYLMLQLSKCTLNIKAGSPEDIDGPFCGLTLERAQSHLSLGLVPESLELLQASIKPSSLPECLQTPQLTPLMHSAKAALTITSCQEQHGTLLAQGSQGQRQRPNPG